jgi:hypothetical protein
LRELALHLLDIIENSISAQSKNILVTVSEDTISDILHLSVKDDGIGMDAETAAKVIDPFTTSRTTRKVGLGIPLLKAAAEACNGYLNITSVLGKGTTVDVEFQLSHIDRMPLGDLGSTMLSLVIGSPKVHWVFKYKTNNSEFVFDDKPIKDTLDGVPLSDPAVIGFIREYIEEGILKVKSA